MVVLHDYIYLIMSMNKIKLFWSYFFSFELLKIIKFYLFIISYQYYNFKKDRPLPLIGNSKNGRRARKGQSENRNSELCWWLHEPCGGLCAAARGGGGELSTESRRKSSSNSSLWICFLKICERESVGPHLRGSGLDHEIWGLPSSALIFFF